MIGSGFVWLVGAGPGDPELLTRKGARVLAQADLVLYDALVPAEVLELCPNARRFYVGKRAGRHSLPQEAINRLLVRSARRGLRVARLKGGDPFVFGRGGEEALALAAAGIPFEVVPGVSAALAAPALASIPLTHRGVASGFVVLAGHDPSSWRAAVDSLAPHSLTLVVLMGLAAREAIAARLLARGWAGTTPAAVLWGASRPDSRTWRGDLRGLGAAVPAEGALADAPGTIVVGEVVSLAAALAPETPQRAAANGGYR